MVRSRLPALAAFAATSLLLAATACSTSIESRPPPKPEPTFKKGEYGGPALPGTEELYNLMPSPDGERIALVRARTPDASTDPRNQLWIVDRDGSNPRLISVNTTGAHWHPNGNRLAVTVSVGADFYVYTIDLSTLEATQWAGGDEQRISLPVVSSSGWFDDGHRILVFVHQKAYQQPFERGLYVIDTRDSTTTGPIVELMQGTTFGNDQRYVVGRKYLPDRGPKDGNFARFDFADSTWHWITDFPPDTLEWRLARPPSASPASDLVAQPRFVGFAQQLFVFRADRDGTDDDARQVTDLGGENPRWLSDGSGFLFKRDVHRGNGARYIPFIYDVETGESNPLWPALPDSVPDFPDLSTQTLSTSLDWK